MIAMSHLMKGAGSARGWKLSASETKIYVTLEEAERKLPDVPDVVYRTVSSRSEIIIIIRCVIQATCTERSVNKPLLNGSIFVS